MYISSFEENVNIFFTIGCQDFLQLLCLQTVQLVKKGKKKGCDLGSVPL